MTSETQTLCNWLFETQFRGISDGTVVLSCDLNTYFTKITKNPPNKVLTI